MRDIEQNPYSVDEQRVADFFFECGTGGGDDPIGYLIASHKYLAAERNEYKGSRAMRQDEYGWLIERANSTAGEPKYWCAGMADPNTFSAWTSNHAHAIRFARKLDAERVAERMMKGIEARIVEHAWDAP